VKAVVAVVVVLGCPAAARASLTEGPRLAAIYDAILAADFPRADAQLRESCPPAPAEACATLEAAARWWQIHINPESPLDDQRFTDAAARAIKVNDAWTRREPANAEAWFYLAGAYGPLVQWKILRGERVSAARDGARIKAALERALKLDPTLVDAHFGIGLYHYYAAVAPAYAKMLRWLLLLPGGNRELGLREMIEARADGELLKGEADYQLHFVYLWYENRPQDAIALLESLEARYPTNPLFLQRIAEATDTYLHDSRASAARWRELLDRARAGRVHASAATEIRARLGVAAMQIELGEIDSAIEQLQIVIAARPAAPVGARARAESLLRTARARRNF
jgi:hypothetical protein